jgi:hypothetical protein
MQIAAILVIHDHPAVVQDTIESVRRYMTKDVLAVVDPSGQFRRLQTKTRLGGAICDVYAGDGDRFRGHHLAAHQIQGLRHNHHRAPYRNMVLGLQTASEMWDADWYCYLDYDALVASEGFKERLETDAWVVGNDHRVGNLKFPLIESLAGVQIKESHYLIGCCHFINRKLIDRLKEVNFFERFLWATNDFQAGFFPGHTEQTCYDVGEYIMPSLAVAMGGRVEELAYFDHTNQWRGDPRFPLRFRPDLIPQFDSYEEASILHPVKDYAGIIREYHRKKRNEL